MAKAERDEGEAILKDFPRLQVLELTRYPLQKELWTEGAYPLIPKYTDSLTYRISQETLKQLKGLETWQTKTISNKRYKCVGGGCYRVSHNITKEVDRKVNNYLSIVQKIKEKLTFGKIKLQIIFKEHNTTMSLKTHKNFALALDLLNELAL